MHTMELACASMSMSLGSLARGGNGTNGLGNLGSTIPIGNVSGNYGIGSHGPILTSAGIAAKTPQNSLALGALT